LILELCNLLYDLPSMVDRNDFWSLLKHVKDQATKGNNVHLLNWLKNKEGDNSWILECLSRATSEMSPADWYSTSHTTNIAESAHAYSQRSGTRLNLVSAVLRGKQLDHLFLEGEAAQRQGIGSRYGNNSVTGRATKNLQRRQKVVKKKLKNDPIMQQQEAILARAQELIHEGMSMDVVELFLKTEKEKQMAKDS
jgi:hypothetical protein